jgi:hypothetical protein
MATQRLTEAERLRLIRNGKTICVVCGDEMDALGGGKTRKRYCSPKCKDKSRRRRINQDVQSMGATCYRIWLALPKGSEAREQYVDWIMYLGTTGWRYAYMFRYRWSQARTVVIKHFEEELGSDEGKAALTRYLERPTVKRWRVPSARPPSNGCGKRTTT